MTESQWDAVIAVHLKGHFIMLHHAAEYWKGQSKAGEQPNAAVINTASASGLTVPNAGQANYGCAKAAIAALTLVAAEELQRYGVRVNAIAPIARTRPTSATPGMGALMGEPEDGGHDMFSPATSLLSWPTWRRTNAHSPARCPRFRGARFRNWRVGTMWRPSKPMIYGRSTTSPLVCPTEHKQTRDNHRCSSGQNVISSSRIPPIADRGPRTSRAVIPAYSSYTGFTKCAVA